MSDAPPEEKRGLKLFSLFFGAYCVLVFAAVPLFVLANQPAAEQALSITSPFIWFAVLCTGVLGSVITYRRPEHRIGWLFVISAVFGQTVYLQSVASVLLLTGSEPNVALTAALVSFQQWGSGVFSILLAYALILFPTGRLPSARWKPAVWLVAAALLLIVGISFYNINNVYRSRAQEEPGGLVFSPAAAPSEGSDIVPPDVSSPPETTPFVGVFALCAAVLAALGALAQFKQYRGGDFVVQRQIRWLILPLALWAVFIPLIFGPVRLFPPHWYPALRAAVSLIVSFVPMVIAIAILRYRLYDIDIIIHRSLVYGLLTAVLLAIYLVIVLLAQSAFVALTGQESPIAIVISTLVIAALFNPLRQRVQAFVDRRFYRRKYDAALTLEEFARTARDEVDLAHLSVVLMQSVDKTMQPEWAGLWLKPDKQQ